MSPYNALHHRGVWENCNKASGVLNHCGRFMDGLAWHGGYSTSAVQPIVTELSGLQSLCKAVLCGYL
jgi:hypothetical protein